MKDKQQLNVLAGAVHGVMCALNLLAFGYSALRGKRIRATFHLGAAIYEAHAVSLHAKEER